MSDLKDRLYNYEETPPSAIWEKIATSLDESHLTEAFPAKLYNAEVKPPADSWDKIASTLDARPAANTRFLFFRYAAAAVLIGVISFGIIKWVNKTSNSTPPGLAVNDKTNGGTQQPVATPNANESLPNEKQPPAAVATEPTQEAETESPAKSSVARKIKSSYAASYNNEAVEPIYAYNETSKIADRYIMYMTPDGGIVRMSKKWGNLVCCVSGQEQDEDCKDQIRKWQEKLACAPAANSGFIDILSLVSTLNATEL